MQRWRPVPRCQIRDVQEDSVMHQLECQFQQSSLMLSLLSLSLLLYLALLHRIIINADIDTTEDAIVTRNTLALMNTVPE